MRILSISQFKIQDIRSFIKICNGVRSILEITPKSSQWEHLPNQVWDSSQSPPLGPTSPPDSRDLRPQHRSPLHFDLFVTWSLALLEVLFSWPLATSPWSSPFLPFLSSSSTTLSTAPSLPQRTPVWPGWQLLVGHASAYGSFSGPPFLIARARWGLPHLCFQAILLLPLVLHGNAHLTFLNLLFGITKKFPGKL